MSAETHTQHSVERAVRVANRRFQVRSLAGSRWGARHLFRSRRVRKPAFTLKKTASCRQPRKMRKSCRHGGEGSFSRRLANRRARASITYNSSFFPIFYTFFYLLHLTTPINFASTTVGTRRPLEQTSLSHNERAASLASHVDSKRFFGTTGSPIASTSTLFSVQF